MENPCDNIGAKVMAMKKRREKVYVAEESLVEVFDVDTEAANTTTSAQPQPWVLGLTLDDEQILINGDWLTDSLISAGQQLIQQTFPHIRGLQDVSLAHTLAFNVEQGEFIQVLHNGHDHWVMVSTIGCGPAEVDIFDSLPPTLTGSLERQIAAILASEQDSIRVRYILVYKYMYNIYYYSLCLYCNNLNFRHTCRYMLCQVQNGSPDCGIFALAHASVFASGLHPSSCYFEQHRMRTHLHTCLAEGNFSPFPIRRIGRENKKRVRMCRKIKVFCNCRMPESFGDSLMIQCGWCQQWYHLGLCVTVSDPKSEWFCSNC